jgi:hypothetical protein
MNEIPERIEREMFEIRSRMAPDVQDLKKHTEPQVIGKQVSTRIRDRIKGALTRAGRSLVDSAKRQVRLAGEAGRERDPSAFTDAVKSDPRPLALLAIVLAVTLLMARRISNGRGE